MYYVGWMPTVLTPFQNHVGLAVRDRGHAWRRFSRAPILERTDEEFLSIGSVSVLRDGGLWRMWYTCFRQWGEARGDPKHVYWRVGHGVCIDVGRTTPSGMKERNTIAMLRAPLSH